MNYVVGNHSHHPIGFAGRVRMVHEMKTPLERAEGIVIFIWNLALIEVAIVFAALAVGLIKFLLNQCWTVNWLFQAYQIGGGCR